MTRSCAVYCCIAGFALASPAHAVDDPTLEQRLDRLSEILEEARVDAHIPGMSIAIVKDDEVIWTHGFGLADVATKRPADEHTIYAIGSTTKAMTLSLVGMLVDEGKIGWDDPVTDYLPYFDLAIDSDDPNDQCTMRDLLSHRHGFTRMGILWLNGSLSRDEVLHTAAMAEPWDTYRHGFHYCNVTYLAAGEAAGVAAGISWDEMMTSRIFGPLGMTSSTLSRAEAQKDSRLALGYTWDADTKAFEHDEMMDLSVIGPAGSVNSNVVDMAQWLKLQLAKGEVDGKRLLSAQSIEETWTPQIEIGGGVDYGMGWMLHEMDGRRVVEHGGNIAGFSAQIGLVPDESFGFVLLTNLSMAPLQQSSLKIVFDAMLDEWPDQSVELEADEIAFEDYTGVYVADFATFRDEQFEVINEGDKLFLNIPSQRKFELKNPDQDGMWEFVLTDQIKLTFDRDDENNVVGIKLHQGGYAFEIPRKGHVNDNVTPAEELEPFTGTYVWENGERQVKIIMLNGRLAIEDKGNRLTFHTPDERGHTSLRARAEQGATFNTDSEGGIESFTFHGDAGDQLFIRLDESLNDTSSKPLPTLEEILTLRKTDERIAANAALNANEGTKVTGEIWMANSGVRGVMTLQTQGNDRYSNRIDLGRYGRIEVVTDGESAWSYNPMTGLRTLYGDELMQAIVGHPLSVDGDWNHYFDAVEVERHDTINERPAFVVRLKKDGLPSRTYWVDAEFGDVVQVKLITLESSVRIPVEVTYSDFREVDGIRVAHRIVSKNPESGKTIIKLESIESGIPMSDETFTLDALNKNE